MICEGQRGACWRRVIVGLQRATATTRGRATACGAEIPAFGVGNADNKWKCRELE